MAQHERADSCGLAVIRDVQGQTGHKSWGEGKKNQKKKNKSGQKQQKMGEIAWVGQEEVAVNCERGIKLQTVHNKAGGKNGREGKMKKKGARESQIGERRRRYLRRAKTQCGAENAPGCPGVQAWVQTFKSRTQTKSRKEQGRTGENKLNKPGHVQIYTAKNNNKKDGNWFLALV